MKTYLRLMRINQWIKNLVVFMAITFSGNLADLNAFLATVYTCVLFCLLSSASYIINDMVDVHNDRKHPTKQFRPIASGEITIPSASFLAFILIVLSLILALVFNDFLCTISVCGSNNYYLLVLAITFISLHLFYSLYVKRFAIVDIFVISFSFMIRAFAGEFATGYHIPIWLILTVFFGSLFIATIKRHAEIVINGAKARVNLLRYKDYLLLFLTNTFATATIFSYALYSYFINDITSERGDIVYLFKDWFPRFEGRKWFMLTIPLVVYGIARYAQLLYEKEDGESPEKIITTDKPLIITMVTWALMVVILIYVF